MNLLPFHGCLVGAGGDGAGGDGAGGEASELKFKKNENNQKFKIMHVRATKN